MALKVLYEDNHLIAVFKPAGVLTQKDKTNVPTLMESVKDYLKLKYNKPGNVFLGLLHRLDQPVSGIVLFAKTSKGASRLSEQFRNRTIKKTYHCLISGKPKSPNGELSDFIEKDRENNRVEVSNRGLAKEKAELSYETEESNGRYSLLKVTIKTGKPHQIRAQLANIGCPIIGDTKYGGPKSEFLALLATGLEFQTATGEKTIKLTIPLLREWEKMLNKNG
jgi:23S rRNA pseudouridine1911/1915/1917 synthase